jgi:hypothetical protein
MTDMLVVAPTALSTPRIPSRLQAPSGSDWVQEIKHDRFRLIMRRESEMCTYRGLRLF